MNFDFTSQDELTQKVMDYGIHDFHSLLYFVRNLPYGRNSNREDLYLVISESKGTCSSKHAFLKAVADENEFFEVKLILAIYKMNEKNTPQIFPVLTENKLDYIPEAHCYLKFKEERIDVTSSSSDFKRIENDIFLEMEIEPWQVSEFKINYHKIYLKTWFQKQKLNYTFNEIWEIREKCIQNISS